MNPVPCNECNETPNRKYVGWDRLAELVRTHRGNTLLDALQVQARLPGSGKFQDDFTAVVLQSQSTKAG